MRSSPRTPTVGCFDGDQIQKAAEANVRVVCRVLPLLAKSSRCQATQSLVECVDNHTVHVHGKDSLNVFTFDGVCGEESSQEDVYRQVAHDTVESFFSGFNGCILAYGQTGSGKSHTMFGGPDDPGVVPRVSDGIFHHISHASPDVDYTVSVSFMEIHMEKMRDLLDDNQDHDTNSHQELSIHEDTNSGVHVRGLSHAFVTSSGELNEVVRKGTSIRRATATAMNIQSSRSHAILRICLHQRMGTGTEIRSSLFLVDLAGSEKAHRSAAAGVALDEARKINSSLSTLGLVINSLADPTASHVPYRDLKLTRILQDSLGGNSNTTLVVTCLPAIGDVSETVSTLRFGARAKRVKNRLRANTHPSVAQLKARIAELEMANADLHRGSSYRGISGMTSLLSPRGVTNWDSTLSLSLVDELARKDSKIAALEKELLELKMAHLKRDHDDDVKVFKLECALHALNDKFNEVELVNENLRKHLLISEKIIASRDVKINRLRDLLAEQQGHVDAESSQFLAEYRRLQEKLAINADGHDSNGFVENHENEISRANDSAHTTTPTVSLSGNNSVDTGIPDVASPKGLNLRIVKPVRGGGSVDLGRGDENTP